MRRVEGKVAIVTGAARGLGAAHARRLVEEGARVVLTDILEREGMQTASSLGARACFVRHDVTSEEDWQRVVAEAESVFGSVSVLVNNAGVLPVIGPMETLDVADYRRVIDVNQVSVFLGMKTILPSMKRAGGGSIINISSVAGMIGTPCTYAYTASKFAVRGMTKAAAIEFAPFLIRVNSVHPGLIRTDMTAVTPNNEATVVKAASTTPAARLGDPDEIANVVVMLASDESRFATGAEFVIDGGLTCQ